MIYNSYEVAKIIGVNVSTIKRWADSGKIKCFKTRGGHRKFHLKHLREFVKSDKKGHTSLNLSSLVGKSSKLLKAIDSADSKLISSYIFDSLVKGDKNKFISLTNSLIIKGFPFYYIFDEIILPTLVKIGEEWRANKLSITEEHLASEVIKKFLSSVDNKVVSSKISKNAFCFTLSNDKHDIPLLMAEVIFNQIENVFTFNLGANLPVSDFINESSKIVPHIIFISIVYVEDIDIANNELKLLLSHFKDSGTKIFLSGNALKMLDVDPSSFTQINSFEELQQNILKL